MLVKKVIKKQFMKRLVDIGCSIILLLTISPILFFLFKIVRLLIGHPVILKQTRPGYKGKIFTFFKFRTMTTKRDSNGKLLQDKVRITPIGAFLRKTSLDELPSLFNVLIGVMSLGGPRPLLVEYLGLYSPEQAHRHDVKPGITGWAQVNGRNAISWEEKFELDVWYVDNHSLMLDLKILFRTIFKVLKRDGISSHTHVTMEVFKGSND